MASKKQLKKTTPKLNKAKKPVEIEPKIESDEVYRCTCCGHKYTKQERNFNASRSPIYKGNNGYTSICKNCTTDLYNQYIDFFDKSEDDAMERICQITDMYFDEMAWIASRKTGQPNGRIGSYISKLNLNSNKGKNTYSDTLIDRWESQAESVDNIGDTEQLEKVAITEETMRRFGTGFNDGEYETLQYEYNTWVEKYGEPEDKRQEELYSMSAVLKLSFQRAVQLGTNNIGQIANTYKAFIEAATVEIEDRRQKKKEEIILKPIGMLYRDIEMYCPAEFYKDKKLYADFDKLKEYFLRFLARPLRNLLTGSKELDKEFNLSSAED